MLSSVLVLFLIAVPMIVQAFALAVDEFHYHHKRGLPRWECVGHPLDTLTVLGVASISCFYPLGSLSFVVFVVTGFLSCLFVTKDEWVHAKLCDAGEQWLHSVLFIAHPLVFVSTAVLWSWRDKPHVLGLDATLVPQAHLLLLGQVVLLAGFLTYQIIYWNFVRQPVSDSDGRLKPQVMKSGSADPRSFVSGTG